MSWFFSKDKDKKNKPPITKNEKKLLKKSPKLKKIYDEHSKIIEETDDLLDQLMEDAIAPEENFEKEKQEAIKKYQTKTAVFLREQGWFFDAVKNIVYTTYKNGKPVFDDPDIEELDLNDKNWKEWHSSLSQKDLNLRTNNHVQIIFPYI